jgi:hypothetical protein
MSKSAPNNAEIVFKLDEKEQRFVYKKYYHQYRAFEEIDSYRELGDCLRQTDQPARVARVYSWSDRDNSINLEFIAGPTLLELLRGGEVYILQELEEVLVTVFSCASRENFCFDSDPSNIFYDGSTGEVVFIDPVCIKLDLGDYAAVVFLWGLIKIALRNPRVWQSYRLWRYARNFQRAYALRVDTNSDALSKQIANYVDTVISWNLEIKQREGWLVRMFRKVCVVPLYKVVQQLLSRGADL